jgi:FAD/FMN-containing dehydrogenase
VSSVELRHALGPLCVDAPDGLYASPRSPRQLAEVLAVLKAQGAVLGREVKFSRGAFDRLEGIEPRACTAQAGAGIAVAELERALGSHALTLGPLSPGMLKLTLGELLEGQYAGLRAAPYGRLEPLCVSLEAVLPDGRVVRTHDSPRSATGPELMSLVLGARGTLAVVISARVRCLPRAQARRTVRFSYPSVEAAIDALKAALADGCALGAVRAQQLASRRVLELELAGAVDAVERDAASLERQAPGLGGRPSGEAPPTVAADAVEAEGTWGDVARALESDAAVELHRLSLQSVVLRGAAVAPRETALAPWRALAAVFDSAGVLGGPPP